MDLILVCVAILFLAGWAFFVYFAFRFRDTDRGGKKDTEALRLLQTQFNERLDEVRRTLDVRLSESIKAIQTNSDKSTEAVKQLNEIQDIFKNSKQRGMLGELSLDLILKNVLPKNYEQQYKFKDGEIVDFVIKIGNQLIPIDSKFSLENYRRKVSADTDSDKAKFDAAFKGDIKNRIDETSKYVRPNEKTVDFAFMFIPSEAIYYDLLDTKIGERDLIFYAAEKHVTIVSPATLMAYLQTVLEGLRALHITEQTREILKNLVNLQRHLKAYQEYMDKIRNNIATLTNTYELASGELKKIDKDIFRINSGSPDMVSKEIEAPKGDDESLF